MAYRVKESGFTIIELLIATAVFSVVLVIVMASFIQISRIFYKGVNMSNTQDDTRNALTDLASDIQFASSTPATVDSGLSSSGTFCIGAHLYAYYTGQQVGTSSQAGIYRQDGNANVCPSSIDFTKPVDQLLGSGMQLNYLYIYCNGTICQIKTHVIFYGGAPDGLFATNTPGYGTNPWQAPDADCTGALTSSQYCATADFKRTVLQRI